jgi:hypothetical protein
MSIDGHMEGLSPEILLLPLSGGTDTSTQGSACVASAADYLVDRTGQLPRQTVHGIVILLSVSCEVGVECSQLYIRQD